MYYLLYKLAAKPLSGSKVQSPFVLSLFKCPPCSQGVDLEEVTLVIFLLFTMFSFPEKKAHKSKMFKTMPKYILSKMYESLNIQKND